MYHVSDSTFKTISHFPTQDELWYCNYRDVAKVSDNAKFAADRSTNNFEKIRNPPSRVEFSPLLMIEAFVKGVKRGGKILLSSLPETGDPVNVFQSS